MVEKEEFEQAYQKGLKMAEEAYVKYAEAEYKSPKYAVVQHANPLDDSSPILKAWTLTDVCGFVHLEIDGKSAFWRWLKKTGKVESYESNKYFKFPLAVGNGGNGDLGAQEDAFSAFVKVIRDAVGVQIYEVSRID